MGEPEYITRYRLPKHKLEAYLKTKFSNVDVQVRMIPRQLVLDVEECFYE